LRYVFERENQYKQLLMKNYFFIPVFFFALAASAQSNYAVNFDGTNDYVNTPAYVVPTSGNFTVELWVYATSYTGYQEFVSQGSSGSAFYIGITNSTGIIRCGDNWGSTGITMPLNQWVHIALVKSGGGAILYLNGVQKATLASGYSVGSGGSNFEMGTQYGGLGEYFNGKIDEVRVWNVARTQADIKTNMFNKNLSNSASGLVAYYRTNEGSGTSTVNACTNTTGIDGTLTNGPTWSASPIQFAGNGLSFDGVDDYVISTATFNLNMGGSSFTVEAWINSANSSANTTTERILMQWGPTWQAGSYQLVCTNSYINFNFNGSSTGSCTYNVNWQDGNWHHVAGVFDISTYTLYLYYDGVQKAAVSTAGHAPGALNTSLYIGGSPSVANSFVSAKIDEVRVWNYARSQAEIQGNMGHELNYPFNVSATVPRLYYIFDQGIAGEDNTGLTPVIEQYLQAHGNGTLVNFALSGSSSNYVTQNSSLTILPLKWLSFTAQKQNSAVLLEWRTASEINTSDFWIERSVDGKNWKTIGNVSAAGNSTEMQRYAYLDYITVNGMNYYRIRQYDNDGKYSYSKIVSVTISAETKPFKLIANPVVNKTLQLEINFSSTQIITLISNDGKIVWRKEFIRGTHTVNLNSLSKGVYFLKSKNCFEKFLVQ
jgi:hypothetical protein